MHPVVHVILHDMISVNFSLIELYYKLSVCLGVRIKYEIRLTWGLNILFRMLVTLLGLD